MSTVNFDVPTIIGPPPSPPDTRDGHKTIVSEIDDHRGTYGMMLFITTEAFLFIMLFTSYFYLAQDTWRWLSEKPPHLHYVLPMLAILLGSSGVAYWGEKGVNARKYGRGKLALIITILMGLLFLLLSVFDYKEHWQDVTPQTNAYGSIFYTIVTLHVAHVIVGLLMLSYVLLLPRWEPVTRPPFRPYHNATMYWHFVDFVWVFIVFFLYAAPNMR